MTNPEYIAGGTKFLYPRAGDEEPPPSAKVLLLTIGGICTVGQWNNKGFYTGWHPLPKRDKEKEEKLNVIPRKNSHAG